MQQFFISILSLLSKLSHKHVLYVNREKLDPARFATFTNYGFWFCGNIFDYSDIAYGFASSGTVEEPEMDAVRSILRSANKQNYVFYDIGSNTGPYSLLAASSRGDCIVHSFDPVPQHLHILRHSVRLNSFEDRISLHELALSDHKGKAHLTLSGTGSSLEKSFLNKKNKPTIEVLLSDLDSYAKEHELEDPDFIKIDVEGHEMQVVRGMEELIDKTRPLLFIEVAHHLSGNGRTFHNSHFQEFFDFFKKKGYEIFRSEEKRFVKFTPAFREMGVHMYLFIHGDAHKDIKRIINV